MNHRVGREEGGKQKVMQTSAYRKVTFYSLSKISCQDQVCSVLNSLIGAVNVSDRLVNVD